MKRLTAQVRYPLLFASVVSLASLATCLAAAAPSPLEVFILAGQSNMEGQAVADLDGKDYNHGKGTVELLAASQSPGNGRGQNTQRTTLPESEVGVVTAHSETENSTSTAVGSPISSKARDIGAIRPARSP